MSNNMKLTRFYLWGALSHIGLVLSLMFFVFLIVDRYNRAMAFVNNDITKRLLIFGAIVTFALCRLCLPVAKTYSKRARAILYDLIFLGAMFSMALIFMFYLDTEVMIINTSTVKMLITLFSATLLLLSIASAFLHHKDQSLTDTNQNNNKKKTAR